MKAIAVIALMLLPAAVSAQRPNRDRAQRQDNLRNVVEIVIEKKADLTLNDEQVTKLTALAKQLEEKNKPTVEQIQKLRDNGARPRDMNEEQRESMKKAMATIQENRKAALEDVRGVLNDEQKKKLKALLEEMRPERRKQ